VDDSQFLLEIVSQAKRKIKKIMRDPRSQHKLARRDSPLRPTANDEAADMDWLELVC
jgi:hypothetical protein